MPRSSALRAVRAEHLARAAAVLRPRRVVELAAGTGMATAQLVRALPDADLTATDLNPAMVSWAAERVAGATWQQADAQQLDLPDACADLVVCQFGVMFFPDKVAAFAEIARILAPGGTLLFSTWDAVEGSEFTAALVASLAAMFLESPPNFVVRVPHGYADPERMRADVQAAGLLARSIEPLVLRGKSASAQVLAEGFAMGLRSVSSCRTSVHWST